MARAYVNEQLCKECLRCVRNCPSKAVVETETLNSMGFRIVSVDAESCTGCGVCYIVCPDCCFEIR